MDLASHPEVSLDPILRELAAVASLPTGVSSAGYPYLQRPGWTRIRDWVPHVLGAGSRVWAATDRLEVLAEGAGIDVTAALTVVRQILRTAAVTAPPDLWLLRHVLSALHTTGWLDRLAEGVTDPPAPLQPDLLLLLARGYLVRRGAGLAWSDDPTAVAVLAHHRPLPADRPTDLARRWRDTLEGSIEDVDLLVDVVSSPLPPGEPRPPCWVATGADLEIGSRLVPLVLGLKAAGRIPGILEAGRIDTLGLPPALDPGAVAVLDAAGARDRDGALTPLGVRMLQRGPGPFGIIEAYHAYLAVLPELWAGTASGGHTSVVHVARGDNVAASQDANRRTFSQANDALDRYCADTGFRYSVFVEHAVGRGEATRQRWERSGDALTYVGADLEAAAIAAARGEQAAGRLPHAMHFVSEADIGRPEVLVAQMTALGVPTRGAVMVVGNGFHEVRGVTDAQMVEVFRGYHDAGFVLLFTEESALGVDDLLRTAWNTYHAGFGYVHARSGQGLRPADRRPPSGLGPDLPASWNECALAAGYVRVEAHGWRSRRIYPYTPVNGHNPSISVNHFFVPGDLEPADPVQATTDQRAP